MTMSHNVSGRAGTTQIVHLLRNYPHLSRSELATLLRATPATLTHQVRMLLDTGWIRETTARRSGTGGRPRMGLSLDNDAVYAVTVSVGLTTVVVAAVDFGGHIVALREIPHSMSAIAQGITVINDAIQDLVESLAVDRQKWAGLGVAIPGIWDPVSKTVVFSPNLPEWSGMKLGELFRRSSGIETVIVENDADASALGELWFGAGREVQDMMYVLCDVGIGAGLIVNRELVRGQDNSVGEIGHVSVNSCTGEYRCGCGRVGCLEYVASLTALNRYLAEGMTTEAALNVVADYFGTALGSIINMLSPQVVVLGGATLQTYPVLWTLLVQSTRGRILQHLMHKTQLILSPLGVHAPLLGLAALVFEQRIQSDQDTHPGTVSPAQWANPDTDSLKFY